VPAGAPDSYAIATRTGEARQIGSNPPAFTVRVDDLPTWSRLVAAGTYALATAFVDGRVEIEGDLLAAIRWWRAHRHSSWTDRLFGAVNRWRVESWFQTRRRAKRNVSFHYDRSNAFYRQFLDRQMVYSCAYFADPGWSLDRAQAAKLDHICRKLDLIPGDRFLDIGCGWGALVLHAAEHYGALAMGCTLSGEQLAFGRAAARERGLHGAVVIDDLDYRAVPGRFDKIASVGMYEHVGRHRLPEYFRRIAALLEPGGLALNHGIARPAGARDDGSTRFVQERVFPGGELPHLADVIKAAGPAGLEVLDVENLRPHYALTCAAWVARLLARREACLAIVEAAVYRTWLLYIAAAAVGFESGQTDLYQVLLAKRSPRAVRRLTRDYIYQPKS
jgi:cyclopropane-fatty-acyl-phospholipid synthase